MYDFMILTPLGLFHVGTMFFFGLKTKHEFRGKIREKVRTHAAAVFTLSLQIRVVTVQLQKSNGAGNQRNPCTLTLEGTSDR